jgi:TnpA family transposase
LATSRPTSDLPEPDTPVRTIARTFAGDEGIALILVSILGELGASNLFRRLNSYSKQHGLYQALKAFGQILKSHFILRVIDEPALRMAIERVLNGIEHVHRFTRAVSVGNPREFLQAEKQEQEMAEACKRLVNNCIICWNYLYYPRSWRRWMIPSVEKRF